MWRDPPFHVFNILRSLCSLLWHASCVSATLIRCNAAITKWAYKSGCAHPIWMQTDSNLCAFRHVALYDLLRRKTRRKCRNDTAQKQTQRKQLCGLSDPSGTCLGVIRKAVALMLRWAAFTRPSLFIALNKPGSQSLCLYGSKSPRRSHTNMSLLLLLCSYSLEKSNSSWRQAPCKYLMHFMVNISGLSHLCLRCLQECTLYLRKSLQVMRK